MPTEPDKNILDINSSIEIAKPAIDLSSSVLLEARNYSSNLYERCRKTSKAESDEAYPVLALFLHMIQMIDSIEVLISNGCVEPAKLLMRSMFEAKLGLEFMNETMTRTRGIAWIIRNILDDIDWGERHTKTSNKGKEFVRTLEKEGLGAMPDIPDDYISKLQESLEKPDYADVYEEFKRLQEKGRRIEWYSVFKGPNNIRELSDRLNQQSIYDNLYRNSSKQIHVTSSRHLQILDQDGKSMLGPVRNPMNIAHVASYTLGMILQADQTMINRLLSGDLRAFGKWYSAEIAQKHFQLVEGEIAHIKWFEETFISKDE